MLENEYFLKKHSKMISRRPFFWLSRIVRAGTIQQITVLLFFSRMTYHAPQYLRLHDGSFYHVFESQDRSRDSVFSRMSASFHRLIWELLDCLQLCHNFE